MSVLKLEKKDNGVLFITIDREPSYNALNRAFFAEMNDALDMIYDDDSIRVVILTGSGQKAFAAGADIKEFSSFDAQDAKKLSRDGHNVFLRIENSPKPIIAAINGFALGGGCELAMSCHMRVASENAVFGQPEVNLGLTPGYGGTQRLVQLIGKTKALEYLMTGETMKAETALDLGLVNYVVPLDNLMDTAINIASKLILKAPIALGKIVECVNSYYKDGVLGYTTEVNLFSECFETEDFKEGVSAFMEKRDPKFQGK